MAQWPTPRLAREVQWRLGLTKYYRKFVKGYCEALHRLTEKGVPFLWTDHYQECFSTLKSLLTSAPINVEDYHTF